MSWLMSLVVAGTFAYDPSTAAIDSRPIVRPAPIRTVDTLLAGSARQIRSSEARIMQLLSDGSRRSRTFADLVARVHETDLIVYVESVHNLASETMGRTLFQGAAGGRRYLRVQVRSFLQGDHIIALLAHELHHALEVAADKSVVDEPSMASLYQRIGHGSMNARAFETEGARRTGLRVRDELIG